MQASILTILGVRMADISIDWDGSKIHIPSSDIFFPIAVAVAATILFIWSLIWVYKDAEKRGKSGCLVLFLCVVLGWPLGLIAWLVFRPDNTKRRRR